MSVWSDRTQWGRTVWLDVEAVAAVTGLKGDTIYHYVSRNDPKFPQPSSERGRGRNYFSGDQVFRYVLEHRPKARENVPRLYPRVPEPGPAQFLSAMRVRLPDFGYFAVHLWQPADGGSPIAIGYPDRENTVTVHDADKAANELLNGHHLPPEISAVAVPNGEATSVQSADGWQDSPTVVVVERNTVYRPDPVSHGASRYRWPDLANLLRVDIPWWSALLEDLHAMLSWRPGVPATRIRPYTPRLDTGHITALATTDDPVEVRRALGKLECRMLRRLNGETVDDGNRLTPGLIQAAVSTVDITDPEPTLSIAEVAAILHHRTHEHLAKHALRVVDGAALVPLLTFTIRIKPAAAGPMARDWMARLTDVAAPRRNELGFWFVHNYLRTGVRPVRWLTDADCEHSWIIQGDDDVVYVGVGTSTPGAKGQLVEAEIADTAVFFRDTAGGLWPVPDTSYDYYRTGFDGGGPQRLAETLTSLLRDASSEVSDPPNLRDTLNRARFDALYRLVSKKHAPFTVTAAWVAEQAE